MKLNNIDKKILYELGKNARITYRELAVKIGSKQTVIAYHLSNLHKNKVIWKFVPVFSLSKLGIFTFKIYFKFQGQDKDQKKKMLSDFIADPKICWVAEGIGQWEILLGVYASNVIEFSQKRDEIFKNYGSFVEEYAVSIIEDALVFNRDYLISERVDYRKQFIFGGEVQTQRLDIDQKKIIDLIRNNARFQITELAKKLALDVRTVMRKIKDMKERGIIQGYTSFINVNKIDFKFFKVCFYLQDFVDDRWINFCRAQPNIIHIIKSIGSWEWELEIEAENAESIYDLIDKIKTKFPKVIKRIDLTIITKEHKLDFFPERYG